MVDPNFLVIGAQKCGTSWLLEMLRQHPDVFTPSRKELDFFNRPSNYNRGIEWYQNQFAGYQGEKAIGEFTPNYLWVSSSDEKELPSGRIWNAHELVHKHYPDMKLIVSLRDPVQRAISGYHHFIRSRRIAPSSRIVKVGHQYGIIDMGFYHSQLREWFKLFTPDQFLILIFENDIVHNPEHTMRRVYRFLKVDEQFKPANAEKKYHARPGYFYHYLRYYFPKFTRKLASHAPSLTTVLQKIDFPKIKVTDEEIEELAGIYADENRRLETLLGHSLPWKNCGKS